MSAKRKIKAPKNSPRPQAGSRQESSVATWSAPIRMGNTEEEQKISQRLILAALAGQQRHRWPLTAEDFKRPSIVSIIDQFMEVGEHKVVANEQTPEEITLAPSENRGEEGEFVSEQLAEIFVSQGLTERAIETYRKLSLLYPKKSVYFAELIEKLRKDNNN